MDQILSYQETIGAMFHLGILAALWGIYSELRRIADGNITKK